MDKLFAEGGINTGETTVDPVSGNEVPPGSLPSEVRDDINAKLSGGEYVVPADVLRFFGVAFFEDLRRKAKEGLAEMDSDGRIGGGVPEKEEEDFPFSVEELEVEDDMSFAEGGIVPDATPKTTFNPNDWSYDSSMGLGNSTGPTEVKKFKDKNGNIVNVLFINGRPVVDVKSLGYTEYTEETPVATGEKVATPEVQRESSSDRDPQPKEDPKPIDPAKNYYNMSEQDLLTLDYKDVKDNKLLGVGALLSPGLALGAGMFKGVTEAQNLADARARSIIAKERNFDTTALDAQIAEMEKNASGFVKAADIIGLDGTGIAARMKKDFEISGGVKTPNPSVGGSKPSGSSSSSFSGSRSSDKDSGYQAPTATKTVSTPSGTKTVSTPSGTKTVSATPTTTGTRSYTAPTTQQLRDQKATNAGVNVGAYNAATSTKKGTPMAKGGLVEKPQKVVKSQTKRKTKI